jgi:excisionase family DNA binding protein
MAELHALLTIQEFAAALRVKPSCVRRWIAESKISFIRVGRLIRISSAELTRVIQAGTSPAVPTNKIKVTGRGQSI